MRDAGDAEFHWRVLSKHMGQSPELSLCDRHTCPHRLHLVTGFRRSAFLLKATEPRFFRAAWLSRCPLLIPASRLSAI
jgi:hypothetical protein